MRFFAARSTVLVLLVANAAADDAGCPCVDASSLIPKDASGCLAPSCDSPLRLDDATLNSSMCLSTTFGSSSCSAWDALTPVCQTTSPPAYCVQPWCYVDASKCRVATQPFHKSAYFKSGTTNLFYSYSTCGGSNRPFEVHQFLQESALRVLTVVLPTSTYNPYHFKVDPATGLPADAGSLTPAALEVLYRDDAGAPFDGVLVQYLKELASATHPDLGNGPQGFSFTWVSMPSRTLHSSRWTAAVADVAHGHADMGASIFWVTAERLRMTPFTSNLLTDLMYLHVPKPSKSNDWRSQMATPFEPFAPDLWLAVVLVILFHGTLITLLTTRLWWDEWALKYDWANATLGRRALLVAGRLSESWYEAYLMTLNGAPDFDPAHRISTRVSASEHRSIGASKPLGALALTRACAAPPRAYPAPRLGSSATWGRASS